MKKKDHNIFYLPESHFRGKEVIIRGDELRHIRTVLRYRPGEQICLTDGRGRRCIAEIASVERSAMTGMIIHEEQMAAEAILRLTLGFVPVKGLRNDTIIEKGTELGVNRFLLFSSSRSVVKNIGRQKVKRLKKIAANAMVQSRQYYLPEVVCLKNITALFTGDFGYDRMFVADPAGHKTLAPGGQSILLLVGPEGGFSGSEMDYLAERGVEPLNLGPTRLRSETAAIAGITKILVAYTQL
ncbi:16S rRNA (uracil(1498)-N(3))-methyltransferase [candidate division WOR-3 bacterium]|nr:16S rRNA (uracil(1498)-N(3))-methyltransferase [candidate division WOR-3 bacterium]